MEGLDTHEQNQEPPSRARLRLVNSAKSAAPSTAERSRPGPTVFLGLAISCLGRGTLSGAQEAGLYGWKVGAQRVGSSSKEKSCRSIQLLL